jgi:hypothetical protein
MPVIVDRQDALDLASSASLCRARLRSFDVWCLQAALAESVTPGWGIVHHGVADDAMVLDRLGGRRRDFSPARWCCHRSVKSDVEQLVAVNVVHGCHSARGCQLVVRTNLPGRAYIIGPIPPLSWGAVPQGSGRSRRPAKRLKGNIIRERACSIKRPRPPASSLVRVTEPPLVAHPSKSIRARLRRGSGRVWPGGAGFVR